MKKIRQLALIIFLMVFVVGITGCSSTDKIFSSKKSISECTLNILSSSENKDLEPAIKEYVNSQNYDVNFDYAGTLDIMEKLNSGESDCYDAVWLSNSIWMYMLEDDVKVTNSKCTSINPVIFGITKSKANELGFIDKTVYTKDILNAISTGKLKFSMPNPIATNSGASAYLGFLSTLAGNPEVLKKSTLENANLQSDLETLFSGMERSSGSEEFLEELFLNGDYEAVVTYESSIININNSLINNGREPLYAVYPVDGVSISDSPLAYIDNGDDNKKLAFMDMQSYILGAEGQKKLQEYGRRTWYGGVSDNVDKSIFNPNWGIDTKTYISPIKYPSTQVIKYALGLYPSVFRKPVHVVFCLDYSGSMSGDRYEQLVDSMQYILSDDAAADYLQFNKKDKIDVVPFSTDILGTWQTKNGENTDEILRKIKNLKPNGWTALYKAAIEAINLLKNEDFNKYNCSVILMTDGEANSGTFGELCDAYNKLGKKIPIYAIMFGDESDEQLREITDFTNAKTFDESVELKKAFKEVRGYN